MLNEITCDTPISALLDVTKVEGMVNSYNAECGKYQEKLLADITYEQSAGGLSMEAFKIDNDPISYNESEKAKNKVLELSETVSSWKSNILSAAEEQRKQEKMKLMTEVSKKINDLENQLIMLQPTTLLSMVSKDNQQDNSAERARVEAQLAQYREKYLQLLMLN